MFVCSRISQTVVLTLIPGFQLQQGGRYVTQFSKNIKVCLSPPSPLIRNHKKCTIVVSLLCVQQSISAFIKIPQHFWKAWDRLVCLTLLILLCCAKCKGYLRVALSLSGTLAKKCFYIRAFPNTFNDPHILVLKHRSESCTLQVDILVFKQTKQ